MFGKQRCLLNPCIISPSGVSAVCGCLRRSGIGFNNSSFFGGKTGFLFNFFSVLVFSVLGWSRHPTCFRHPVGFLNLEKNMNIYFVLYYQPRNPVAYLWVPRILERRISLYHKFIFFFAREKKILLGRRWQKIGWKSFRRPPRNPTRQGPSLWKKNI